ncbi:MAG: aldo/keto reductase [Eubacteriales bacterium]|jgi:predicted oxidoreductase|nr:aldo/keto reductase [Eubacteriales bacterium]MDD4105332.1 aldo/keto reductase [Eubacteriales bacterium]MDD4710645.1 aldo/keto reductase [Eubacteriales bacterium]
MRLGTSNLQVPKVAVGMMRINKLSAKEAEHFVQNALDIGANFFDHADVYGGDGACEKIFAEAVHMDAAVRDKVLLQSKVGIRRDIAFDFSKRHILDAVDDILSRLKTDYLDVLLLHRPDALVEPEDVAEAFDTLEAQGKVRHFGVSNQKPMQIKLLQKYVKQPIVANQLQLSIMHAGMISNGLHVNMQDENSIDRDGSILDFCRLEEITIQPWSPFQHGFFAGVFLDNEKFPVLNKKIDEIAGNHGVSNTTIAIAWLLRHPAKMQPVTGTMNVTRLSDSVKATGILLTREEWYEIYLAAGNILP